MYAIKDLDVVDLGDEILDTVKKTYADNGYSFEESIPKEVSDKIAEHNSTYIMNLFRDRRNSLLTQTDWWGASDQTMTQEQKDYRKSLRDLPSTASPKLDENGELTNVTWPEKPKEAE